MKKCMLIAFITIFSLVSIGELCSAQSRRGVANTSKKGSLLIYPLIKVDPPNGDGNDTIITISNDYPARVYLQCRYQTPNGCECDPFDFSLTANQSIAFSARTGKAANGSTISGSKPDPFPANLAPVGELRCWAIQSTGTKTPVSWNHLSGTATLLEGENQSWEYSAWRFAVGYGVKVGTPVPNSTDNGKFALRLTGTPTSYDACPEKLLFNFFRQVSDPEDSPYPYTDTGRDTDAENRITLVPCKQDCVSSTPFRARIETSDENEDSDDTYACVNCTTRETAMYDKSLSSTTFEHPTNPFVGHGTPGGMAIVINTPNTDECREVNLGIPMVGVISNRFGSIDGPIAGDTPTVYGRGQAYLKNADGTDSNIEVMMKY